MGQPLENAGRTWRAPRRRANHQVKTTTQPSPDDPGDLAAEASNRCNVYEGVRTTLEIDTSDHQPATVRLLAAAGGALHLQVFVRGGGRVGSGLSRRNKHRCCGTSLPTAAAGSSQRTDRPRRRSQAVSRSDCKLAGSPWLNRVGNFRGGRWHAGDDAHHRYLSFAVSRTVNPSSSRGCAGLR